MDHRICYRNIAQLIQVEDTAPATVNIRERCALIVKNGRVEKVISDSGLHTSSYHQIIDLKGRAVIPGLVDCHTHLIHAGDCKDEMERRIDGTPYMDTLKDGDAILSIVEATRQASESELYLSAKSRMQRMMALGTTAFEIKSGYGLDLQTEMKMLRVGQRLRKSLDVPIILTYLGAHAVPKDSTQADYFEFVLANLPKFRGLADGVDIFCEKGMFSVHDLKRLFLQARLLGFRQLRAHVEKLSHQGGCYDAARLGAISCDHLEYASPPDIQAMHAAGTVAVLMPGVTFFLGGKKLPLAHTMLDSGITLALATDCNPGSGPSYNMQTVLSLAFSMYRLSPQQALVAATLGSAKALGGEEHYGGLQVGQRADFLVLKTPDYRDLFYYFGDNFVQQTYIAGKKIRGGKEPVSSG
jgi:imidazolonepropionase